MRYTIILYLVFTLGFLSQGKAQSTGFEEIKNLEMINNIYEQLDKYFVDNPKIGEISKAGIDAMLEQLDPYTVYYPESNIEDYRLMTTGQYGGIGALIRKDGDYVIIAEPYQDMPAHKAGLKAGDKILSIDGRNMKGEDSETVSKLLKGSKGSSFEMEYDRPNKGKSKVKVERDEIKLPDVPYYGLIDETNKVGYIKLNSFTQSASRDVGKALKELKEGGMEKLIFDLRGNGGGLLMEAINIVNFFVPAGTEIVKTKGRVLDENRTYTTRNNPFDLEMPVVVLIDGNSASASEIVSGSLQDLDRGIVLGETSFGKGLVQRTVDLRYGAKMKLTIAKYYTPSGRCVQKLDYYHKNEGKVDEVPDSLIKIFHTKNGREVIDGRGIEPDVTVELDDFGRITAMLMIKNIIFNFATEFVQKNPEITEAKNFAIDDKTFKEFKDFVLKQDFDYKTASEESLERMLKVAKEEGYEKEMEVKYNALFEVVKASKDSDMDRYREQIEDLLANEIVSRYYFQKGRVLNAFRSDIQLKKALEILNDEKQYKVILNP